MWDSLRNEWRKDFPAIKNITVCQIRHGCGMDWQEYVRNEQRLLADRHPEVRLITTSDIPEHDGCHFGTNGYFAIGERIFKVISKELYGGEFTYAVTAPRLTKAYFATKREKNLFLEFDQPVIWQDTLGKRLMKDYFYFGDVTVRADNGFASGNRVQINLTKRCSIPEISYTTNIYYPDTAEYYKGPFITGATGQPALTFFSQHIDKAPDTVPLISVKALVAKDVEQYSRSVEFIKLETVNYMGETDTVLTGFSLKALDTFLAVATIDGSLHCRNTGTVRIATHFRGFRDTVSVTIIPTTAQLDSLSLSIPQDKIIEGDSLFAGVTAFYRTLDTIFTADVDTIVTWSVSGSDYAKVNGGFLKADSAAQLEMKAELNGVNTSKIIDVYPRPSFMRRIRFAGSTIPERLCWTSDNGNPFRFNDSIGWLAKNRYYMVVPLGSLMLRIALHPSEDDNSIVVIGLDTIKFAKYNGRMVANETLQVTGTEGFMIKTYDRLDYITAISLPSPVDMNNVADDGYEPPVSSEYSFSANNGLKEGLSVSPNPANPSIKIEWYIKENGGQVSIFITDPLGRIVKDWRNIEKKGIKRALIWDGRDNSGRLLPSGLYFCNLGSLKASYIKRIVLLH
ncbi:MAG: T9SS type A sorting domain-containing protein [Fibrobacteres bacterium]|nr:T9SS type A sorting domain-containing protein [Fibrobacterota bacterium]